LLATPRRILAAAATAALATAAFASSAEAATSSGAAKLRSNGRTVSVDLVIDRFAVRHGRAVALASAASRVRTRDGRVRAANQHVTLAVTSGPNCRVLTLRLDKLSLTLLGLTVDTSAINLHITGDRSRALGNLFCHLARALNIRSTASQARVARALNRRIGRRPMHALRFRAAIEPVARKSQATPTCPVLSLTLGPLNLDLLGLLVDLYGANTKAPVVVTITADPNGGTLGRLFCQLAQNAQAQSTG
jgi:hypothetical protein